MWPDWKILASNFIRNVAQICINYWAFWKCHFKVKRRSLPLGQLWIYGLLFILTAQSVWPDLAKCRHFDTILKVLGAFLRVYLACGNFYILLWQKCFAIGQIFIVVDSQIVLNNSVIWSHCAQLIYVLLVSEFWNWLPQIERLLACVSSRNREVT